MERRSDSETDGSEPGRGEAGDGVLGDGAPGDGATRAPATRTTPTWLAFVVFAVLAFVPLRDALLDPGGRTLLAVDTVTSQLPWSAHLAGQGVEPTVANAELSDQGTVFYPYYRWVVQSWLAGDAPLWCPHVFMGAPGLGNPQAGVLDPQVLLLVALEWLFGEGGFRFGLALTAWARLAFGALGAFVLARRLGLTGGAPWIAGLGFGFSAFGVLWLNHPLGHVPAFAPWMLVAVEALVAAREKARSGVGALVALAALTAGCVLAGHPETSFYACAFVGLWCAWRFVVSTGVARVGAAFAAAGLLVGAALAGPMLVPFLEYLEHSAAKLVRETEAPTLGEVDAFGVLAFAALGAVWWWSRRIDGTRRGVVRAVALVLATAALAWRGLPEGAVLAFVPGRFGRPDDPSGYLGPGSYLEEASLFAPLALAALALASALRGRGPLRGRRVFVVGLFLAWFLAQRAPGLLELKRLVPAVGLGATVRLAPVAALGLALLAAEAWQVGRRRERVLGAALVLALLVVVGPFADGLRRSAPAQPFEPQPSDAVGLVVAPAERVDTRRIDLEGWFDPARVENVSVRFASVDPDAPAPALDTASFELFDAPSPAARARVEGGAVGGGATAVPSEVGARARWFRSPYLDASRLAPGHWVAELVLAPRDGGAATTVRVARFEVVRPWRVPAGTWLGLALLALVPFTAGASPLAFLFGVGLALRLVLFAEGLNPAVDARRAFPETATERVLAEAPPASRFMGGPAVLPPNAALVRGLYSLRGYDGMQPASYYNYVGFVVRPGVHRILGWNARGVNLTGPLFRLTAVERIAVAEPLLAPGWSLIAGPDRNAPRYAEVFVYRAVDPLPRAFCVGEVGDLDALTARLASPEGFDPLAFASVDTDWRPAAPLRRATVSAPAFSNNAVEMEVELDGDGLLVLTELMFPGWVAEVDGEERELAHANAVFRGLPLAAGEHRVRFVYRPASLRAGLAALAIGLATLVLLVVAARRARGVRV